MQDKEGKKTFSQMARRIYQLPFKHTTSKKNKLSIKLSTFLIDFKIQFALV